VNQLYYGDNLEILRKYIPNESIDLIYIDPPFNSNQAYNAFFPEVNGSLSKAQIQAFDDTWHWGESTEAAYQAIVETAPPRLVETVKSFRLFLGEMDLMAYLVMMALRLVELHRVLKPTGSFYLHCDPTASHYLKIILDQIFGVNCFRNEIIWCYRKWSISAHQFARNHDVLFFYSKANSHFFEPQFVPVSEGTMRRWKGKKQKAYFVDGVRKASSEEAEQAKTPMSDWWEISIINPAAKERLGYPTQKPETLLERIIQSSSNEGDTVLDAFAGCGTAIAVAQRLNRQWLGIDITHLAIAIIKHRLQSAFGDEVTYEIIGEPQDEASARALAQQNRYQFQWWALSLIKARPYQGKKKGADEGVDGVIYFKDKDPQTNKPTTEKIVVQVKSGKVGLKDIKELRTTVENQSAVIGVFITLEPPTDPMKIEAVRAGSYQRFQMKYPKIQICTIGELLKGKRIEYPQTTENITFKKAERAIQKDEQLELL